jgi:hypothetical protein
MSNSEEETGISDEQLPDDLQPGEDNPLAEGLEAGESAGDLLEDGKDAEQTAGDDDADPEATAGREGPGDSADVGDPGDSGHSGT